jgi:hypothetical protein
VELTPEMIVGSAAAMGAAIVWLARNQWTGQRECKRESAECRSKHAELEAFIRNQLLGMVESGAARESESNAELGRARRVLERVERHHRPDPEETPSAPARVHA